MSRIPRSPVVLLTLLAGALATATPAAARPWPGPEVPLPRYAGVLEQAPVVEPVGWSWLVVAVVTALLVGVLTATVWSRRGTSLASDPPRVAAPGAAGTRLVEVSSD